MKNSYIGMGCYYRNSDGKLIKTITMAKDEKNEMNVVFAYVENGGFVSEPYVVSESVFRKVYM